MMEIELQMPVIKLQGLSIELRGFMIEIQELVIELQELAINKQDANSGGHVAHRDFQKSIVMWNVTTR